MSSFCGVERLFNLPWHPKQKIFRDFVDSRAFSLGLCLLIIVNLIIIGWASHDEVVREIEIYFDGSSSWRSQTIFYLEMGFNVVFVIEFFIRLAAGEALECFQKGFRWKLLDLTMGLESVAELAFAYYYDVRFGYIRVLRLVRFVRMFRMVRLLKFARLFRTLRLMLLALCQATGPLMWAVFILICIIFFFSVILVDAVISYVHNAQVGNPHVGYHEGSTSLACRAQC